MPIQPVSGEIKAQPLNNNFSFLDSKIYQINGGPKETFTSLSALQSKYPSGSTSAMLVLESDGKTGYLYTWNGSNWIKGALYQATGIADSTVGFSEIKDEGVNYNNVAFVNVSKNKFDLTKLQPNGYHNYVTGAWTQNNSYDTSGKIPCRPGQQWTSRFTRWVCYFDKNGGFLTGGFAAGTADVQSTFTIPAGVNFFEVTALKTNTIKQQIEIGTTLSEFEDFSLEIPKLKVEIDPVFDIPLDTLSVDKMDFIKQGKNLFNLNKSTKGYYVNPVTGALVLSPNYVSSAMIPTYGNAVALQGVRFYALYTKDGAYLSGETLSGEKVVDASKMHSWIRISPTSGLEAAAQVEYGNEVTTFEPYEATLDGVTTESQRDSKPLINLPSKIYATVNKEVAIFQQNITLSEGVNFRWGRGIQGQLGYKETFPSSTTANLSVEVYKDGRLLNGKPVSLIVSESRSTLVKVLLFGDSTVNAATTNPTGEARLGFHILEEMGGNAQLIGSRGVGDSRHEGRPGWTAKDYRTDKNDVTGSNPFFSSDINDFSFEHYIDQTGVEVPDVFVIQLGINDLFNYTSDDAAYEKIVDFINDMNFIVENIKAYNDEIKIIVNLPFPPTEKIDVFAETYVNNNLPQWRYKRNNYLLVSEMIKQYESNQNVLLNAINKGINVFENIRDGVHPTDDGYLQVARQIVACLNSI